DEAEDADVRCDAAEGLLLLGGERARQALESAAEKVREERVRRVVSVCLSLFGKPVEELRSYLPLTGEEIVSGTTWNSSTRPPTRTPTPSTPTARRCSSAHGRPASRGSPRSRRGRAPGVYAGPGS